MSAQYLVRHIAKDRGRHYGTLRSVNGEEDEIAAIYDIPMRCTVIPDRP